MTKRISSVDNIIKKEIGDIVFRTIDVGRDILTTITRVETSSNIIQAKVYVSVMPDNQFDRIMGILNRKIYYIQQILNKKLRMRPIPKIIFLKEEKIKYASDIEKMIESLKKNK